MAKKKKQQNTPSIPPESDKKTVVEVTSLKELIDGIDATHKEWDTGPSVGNEAW